MNPPGIAARAKIFKPAPDWSDEDLVAACLTGDHRAWEALLSKYQRLIYSVPLRYGLSPDDAADVFQNVCLDLYRDLAQLRNAAAIRGWLVRAATNKAFRLKKRSSRLAQDDSDPDTGGPVVMPDWAADLERDQLVREAMAQIQPRCRELIRMLFFEDPPRSYDQVAAQLGLATGSIGFIRGRCLQKLEKALREAGL